MPGKDSQSPKGVCTDPVGSHLMRDRVCSGPVVGLNTKDLKSMRVWRVVLREHKK